MPSPEFMKDILSSESAQLARGELPEGYEIVEEELPEPAEEEEAPDDDAPEEDEETEEVEKVPEEPAEDDEAEADEEPSAEEHDEFYVGRYRTREDAERGIEETKRAYYESSQRSAEVERELQEVKQQLAYMQGRIAQDDGGGGFDEWADAYVEQNPEQGMREAIQASLQTGDQSYAYAYTDRWADKDPYQAAIWRNRLETAVFTQQEPSQSEREQIAARNAEIDQVLNETWVALTEEYPDMQNEATVSGMATVLHNDADLKAATLTADPAQVKLAFLAARRIHQSTASSRPRTRRADAERVESEKRAATVPTGDGSPSRRSSSPVLSPEEEMILAGADKLGLRRRDDE